MKEIKELPYKYKEGNKIDLSMDDETFEEFKKDGILPAYSFVLCVSGYSRMIYSIEKEIHPNIETLHTCLRFSPKQRGRRKGLEREIKFRVIMKQVIMQ